jgi:hypothetical protein
MAPREKTLDLSDLHSCCVKAVPIEPANKSFARYATAVPALSIH